MKYNSIFVKQTSHYLHHNCLFRYSKQIQFKTKKNEKQKRNYDSAKCWNLHFIIKYTCMSGPTSNMKYFNEYFCLKWPRVVYLDAFSYYSFAILIKLDKFLFLTRYFSSQGHTKNEKSWRNTWLMILSWKYSREAKRFYRCT